MMTFGSLFAGVGGFDLGFERSGLSCKWQVEIDQFARTQLERHFPGVVRHDDVRTWPQPTTEPVDIICGGFPCQDISQAGTRAGINGSRSGLWFEFARIIRELRPRYAVVENVSALLVWGIDRILGDLAECGYDAEWQSVRASDFALPHRRERIVIVSYPDEQHEQARLGDCNKQRQEVFAPHHAERDAVRVETTTTADRVDHGISPELYRDGVGCLGNAIVPQLAEWVANLIIERG